MFGSYRFILALLVVINHVMNAVIYWPGAYAVEGFFILSGYLMTLVLNNRYGYSVPGVIDFLVNRALRIYPIYIAMIVLGAILYRYAPEVIGNLQRDIMAPTNVGEWLDQLFIFGIDLRHRIGLMPQAWSLKIELIFYIAMGLALSRNKSLTIVWFILSLEFTIYQMVTGAHFDLRYYTVEAASLPFSSGAMMYYFRDTIKRFVGMKTVVVAGTFFIVHAFASDWIYGGSELMYGVSDIPYRGSEGIVTIGYYVSMTLSMIVTAGLLSIDPKRVPEQWRQIDTTLGDLSYPVFVSHWNVVIFMVALSDYGPVTKNMAFFAIMIVPIVLFSWGLHIAIERPMEPVRKAIRERARHENQKQEPLVTDS